jgi:WD40 repeat protein
MTLQHARIVESVAFSPDGRRIATACLDRTAQIWDANTGQALTPALRHGVPVGHVRFSSDARRLFTASWDPPARIWDADTGRPLTEWLDIEAGWGIPCFDPAGGRVIMGARNGIAQVWNTPEASVPVPAWFPKFAEALAGVRLGARGHVELVAGNELSQLVGEIAAQEANGFYEHLALRLVAPHALRE